MHNTFTTLLKKSGPTIPSVALMRAYPRRRQVEGAEGGDQGWHLEVEEVVDEEGCRRQRLMASLVEAVEEVLESISRTTDCREVEAGPEGWSRTNCVVTRA